MPKEYIDREAAVKAVYQYLLEQTVSKYATSELCIYARGAISRAMDVLDDVPAADVAPVVRCKNCKHYSYLGSCLIHSEIADEYSTGFDFRMDDNDFCSFGEKKEEQ